MRASMKAAVCIIGAGPAGLIAAVHAAQAGAATMVVEANAAAGRKLLLTGGGRCNFTHAGSAQELARTFGTAGRFLRHSLYELPPDNVREFFRSRGLASRIEPDGCVFPISDRATDVLHVLISEARRLGVCFLYGRPVIEVEAADKGFLIHTEEQRITAHRVIIATGGVSWPQTGSTGDGYRFAAKLGHKVVPPRPSLVPLITREAWAGELAGVSLPDVRIKTIASGRQFVTTGALVFTQKGIGGPAALDLSYLLADHLSDDAPGIGVAIDMAPDLDEPAFDRQLQERIQAHPKRTVANVLAESIPRQLSQVLCNLLSCDGNLQIGQLKAEVRRRMVASIKGLALTITGAEPIAKATVTHGGVSASQIQPQTMESRIRPGLFFAGEVIDVDGPCGGYNLQACWSTGALAGRSAATSPRKRSQ
jgi:predicted Rossmann fold flavoprotein